MAFKTANTVTPTSANTASPIDAKPKAPKESTKIFIPIAKTMFCLTIFNVFFAKWIASAIFDG